MSFGIYGSGPVLERFVADLERRERGNVWGRPPVGVAVADPSVHKPRFRPRRNESSK